MLDFDEVYGFDKEIAKGNWFKIDGIDVKLAYSDSPEIEKEAHNKRFEAKEKLGRELTDEEINTLSIEIFAELVLLDWQKDMKMKGEDFPCTMENKKFLIRNYPKFTNQCIAKSKDNRLFQEKK